MSQPPVLPEARLYLLVTGRVQGVGFRAYVAASAQMIGGLTGWVRNIGMDQVEVLAEGPRDRLDQLLRAVRSGPRASRVDRVDEQWQDPTGEFADFVVRSSR